MSSVVSWTRLVRYISTDNIVKYGEPVNVDPDANFHQLAKDGKLVLNVLEGSEPLPTTPTEEKETVKDLSGPLTPADVPNIRCIGLNYKSHSGS